MARGDLDPGTKFSRHYGTWITEEDALRLEAVALALGWTHSHLLRWAFRSSIGAAEVAARANAALRLPAPKGKPRP